MGSPNQDVIEINGKKYDAVSGRVVNTELPVPVQHAKSEVVTPHTIHKKTGVALDGFVKGPITHSDVTNTPRQITHSKKVVQKSHTLMRSVVKKPSADVKPPATQAHTAVTHNKSVYNVAPQRMKTAANVPKSPLVSRYGDVQHRSSVIKKTQQLAVKQPVQHVATPHSIKEAPPQAPQLHTPQTHNRSSTTNTHIEKALANATAHQNEQQTHVKKRRKLTHKLGVTPRALAVSTSVLAGVLLGGFFAIQNVPNLSVRVAAARAGFDASMPGYNPAGFSFKGPISYSPGQVTISFRSNTDDRGYSVTQRSSNWNSDALLSNYVVAENKQYQTYLDRGRTLYIYDGSNATWIDNGVWYQVEGNAEMTTDQLVRIAASI